MKKSVLSIFMLAMAAFGYSQTNPTPFDLSTGSYNFTNWPATSAVGTFPTNMVFWTITGNNDPTLITEPDADYALAYNLTSGSRINGLGVDGFSMINTGTSRLGYAVLGLDATGRQDIEVSFTCGTVTVNSRIYALRFQYRTSSTGTWQDFATPIEYENNQTAGHSQSFGPIMLPNTCDNQPDVQVRWFYYYISGSGARPEIRLDDITVTSQVYVPGVGVNLMASATSGSEANPSVITITAKTNDTVSTAQTVSLVVSGNNVTEADYTLSNTTITIPAGSDSASVTFTIVDDNWNEGIEVATVEIASFSAGLSLDSISSIAIEIEDNDQAVLLSTANQANASIDFNELDTVGLNLFNVTRGFYLFEQGNNANAFYRASNGTSTTGDTYSYGEEGSNDRALGSLATGPLSPNTFGAMLVNTTGVVLHGLGVEYMGEQWRGGGAAEDTLIFYYSLNAMGLDDTNATWMHVEQLDFEAIHISNSPTAALDGNDTANSRFISYQIDSLMIQPGDTLWVKWVDNDVASSDHGLAIDELVFIPINIPNPMLSVSSTTIDTIFQSAGGPSDAKAFLLNGSELIADVELSVGGDFEISLDRTTGFGQSITIVPNNASVSDSIYVRLNALANGLYQDTIKIVSNGANSIEIPVVGIMDLGISVNELQSTSIALKAYPTPITKGELIRLNKTVSYTLYSLSGSVCAEKKNANSVETHLLNSGVYFLKTTDGESLKLIIK